MPSRQLRRILTGAACALWCAAMPARGQNSFYVASSGSDANTGTQSAPFQSLERARDAIRASRPRTGATVWLKGGDYPRTQTFQLTAQDSGTPDAPVVYRAVKGETPRLSGSRAIGHWQRVTDAALLNRLPEAARGQVWQSDLKAQGINDFGGLSPFGFSKPLQPTPLELFFDDQPMTLARWPNLPASDAVGAGAWARTGTIAPGANDRFTFENERIARWTTAPDAYLHGYWMHEWADSAVPLGRIEAATHQIVLAQPPGFGVLPNHRFSIFNLIEELDAPGEYYLDRASGVLYFWPPSPLSDASARVSMLQAPLIAVQNASNIVLRGLTLEGGRGAGVSVAGGQNVLVAGCRIRNLGASGVSMRGTGHGVQSCDLSNLGAGGIVLEGGERKSLTAGRNFAVNNDISKYSRWTRTYLPGIKASGVGTRIAHNRIHEAPHFAVQMSGNDHVFEGNEVFRVMLESADGGAFYIGRDFTFRGNVVRGNYFHDIRNQTQGAKAADDTMAVYLDDLASGVEISGNVFERVSRGIMLGGGKDNRIENNVFLNNKLAMSIDARATNWAKAKAAPGGEWKLDERLRAMSFQQAPFSTRYPLLAVIDPNNYALPSGNVVARNIVQGGEWIRWQSGFQNQPAPEVVRVEANLLEGDPGFVAPERGDFGLKPHAPALKIGFEPIPFEQMGLQTDEYRLMK